MRSRAHAGHAGTLVWTGVAVLALAVLLTARWLTPASHGLGTHIALGLPPCGFLLWSGLPCPACGLTTAFAELARGELSRSLAANPLGLPLFALVSALPFAAYAFARRGLSLAEAIDRYQADRVALLVVAGLLVSWAARLLALTH